MTMETASCIHRCGGTGQPSCPVTIRINRWNWREKTAADARYYYTPQSLHRCLSTGRTWTYINTGFARQIANLVDCERLREREHNRLFIKSLTRSISNLFKEMCLHQRSEYCLEVIAAAVFAYLSCIARLVLCPFFGLRVFQSICRNNCRRPRRTLCAWIWLTYIHNDRHHGFEPESLVWFLHLPGSNNL